MPDEPLILAFHSPPGRERARRALRTILGFRIVALLFLCSGPGLVLLALDANPPFPAYAIAIGLGFAVFTAAAGVLVAFLQGAPGFTLEIDETTVRETRDGRSVDRGLDWVVGLRRTGEGVVLRGPARADAVLPSRRADRAAADGGRALDLARDDREARANLRGEARALSASWRR